MLDEKINLLSTQPSKCVHDWRTDGFQSLLVKAHGSLTEHCLLVLGFGLVVTMVPMIGPVLVFRLQRIMSQKFGREKGLAYWPLLLWLPLLAVQYTAARAINLSKLLGLQNCAASFRTARLHFLAAACRPGRQMAFDSA